MHPPLFQTSAPPTPPITPDYRQQTSDALALIKYDLRHFLTFVFHELNPATPLDWNWHLEYLCWLLHRTFPPNSPINPTPDDQLQKLIINVPPRSLKSLLASVALKAFLLGHHPHQRIIGASYSGKLATKFNRDLIRVMSSETYRTIFPNTVLAKTSEAEVTTTANGHALATSVTGTVTGLGGYYLIADDILNADQANSPTEVEHANYFFTNSFYPSRLDDKRTGVCILIQQRLQINDTTGTLLEQNEHLPPSEQWYHACLPAIHTEPDPKTYHFFNKTHTQHENDLLHPSRDTHDQLKAIRAAKGSHMFDTQYLQNPTPADSAIIKIHSAPTYDPKNPPPCFKDPTQIVLSLDTAIKSSSRSDYSVCLPFLEDDNHNSYLLSPEHFPSLFFAWKIEYPMLKEKARSLYHPITPDPVNHPNDHQYPTTILIEDKASGQQLIQDLRSATPLPVIPVRPSNQRDAKLTRIATVISPQIEARTLHLPNDLNDGKTGRIFLQQCMNYPKAAHDDFPDAMAQYLDYKRKSSLITPQIRVL